MMQSNSDSQRLLRNSLIGNALFSVTSALIILGWGQYLAEFLGLRGHLALTVLAIGLIAYAFILVVSACRPQIKLGDAWTAVVLDAVWVLGSYTLIFIVPFRPGGKWLIVAVAEVVFGFALLQSLGIRRALRNQQTV